MTDILMVFAVLAGPLLAVQVQKWLETRRDRRARQLHIFRVLMATRHAAISPGHVEALNMIDVDFQSVHAVTSAWKAYLDHLSNAPQEDPKDPALWKARNATWAERSPEILAHLLHAMATSLGYRFDETHLKRHVYSPRGLADLEIDQLIIRRGAAMLLSNQTALRIVDASQRPSEPLSDAPAEGGQR